MAAKAALFGFQICNAIAQPDVELRGVTGMLQRAN
jgi:hypothetical protein